MHKRRESITWHLLANGNPEEWVARRNGDWLAPTVPAMALYKKKSNPALQGIGVQEHSPKVFIIETRKTFWNWDIIDLSPVFLYVNQNQKQLCIYKQNSIIYTPLLTSFSTAPRPAVLPSEHIWRAAELGICAILRGECRRPLSADQIVLENRKEWFTAQAFIV